MWQCPSGAPRMTETMTEPVGLISEPIGNVALGQPGTAVFPSTIGDILRTCVTENHHEDGGNIACRDAVARLTDGYVETLTVGGLVPLVALVFVLVLRRKLIRASQLTWFSRLNSRQWLSMCLTGALGVPVGVILGYIVFATPWGAEGTISFSSWLATPISQRCRLVGAVRVRVRRRGRLSPARMTTEWCGKGYRKSGMRLSRAFWGQLSYSS